MITLREHVSVFETDANVIVNPVNCVGVCGKGLALDFKNRYYENFRQYQQYCWDDRMKLGRVFITHDNNDDGLSIINFPTKAHWGKPSKKEWVENALIDMRGYLMAGDTIAMPMVGAGLGGLNSIDILNMIYKHLHDIDDVTVDVCIYKHNSLAELL